MVVHAYNPQAQETGKRQEDHKLMDSLNHTVASVGYKGVCVIVSTPTPKHLPYNHMGHLIHGQFLYKTQTHATRFTAYLQRFKT